MDAGKCCVTESCVGAEAAVAELPREQCCIDARCARIGGAFVSGAAGMLEASETFSSSFSLRHHAWMQANAVSQRAVRVLVPRPLNYSVSDAVSARVAPRNGGACVSRAF